jgi:hypothetical protein
MFLEYKRFLSILTRYFSDNWDKKYIIKPVNNGKVVSSVMKVVSDNSDNTTGKGFAKVVKSNRRKYILHDGDCHSVNMERGDRNNIKVDEYNSIDMGKSEIRNATRKQRIRKVNERCVQEYIESQCLFDEYGVDVKRAVIIEGCYETNRITLQRQATPEVEGKFSMHPTVTNLSVFDKTVKAVFRKLNMPSFEKCNKEEILLENVAIKKKPGYRYEVMYNLQTKGEALHQAYKIALKRWKAIDEGWDDRRKIIPGVYTVGARNKRDYNYTDGEDAVSRAVHMPEMHAELTAAPWCNKITDYFKEKARGPIYIGNSFLQYTRLNNDLKDSSFVIEGDWKRFDSTLYVKIITCALAIERCFFPHKDDNVDRHFIAQYDSLILKDYYVPGGQVIRIFHGLPSGVKSTSALGSIINLIALIFCVGPEMSRFFNFVVGGDDFLIACNRKNIDKDWLGRRINSRAITLGMKLKFLDFKKHNAKRLSDCPCFYKYVVYKGKPYVPPAAYLERVFMPWNKKYNNDVKLMAFLKDVMPSLATPSIHLWYYYKFYSKIHNLLYKKFNLLINPKDVFKMHKSQYDKMICRGGSLLPYKYKLDAGDDEKRLINHLLKKPRGNIALRKYDISCFL